MRNSAFLLLTLSFAAAAQTDQATRIVEQRPPSLYDQLEKNGPGGPAPKRDLTGFWAGPLEPLHHEVYSRVKDFKSALYRDFPDDVRPI